MEIPAFAKLLLNIRLTLKHFPIFFSRLSVVSIKILRNFAAVQYFSY